MVETRVQKAENAYKEAAYTEEAATGTCQGRPNYKDATFQQHRRPSSSNICSGHVRNVSSSHASHSLSSDYSVDSINMAEGNSESLFSSQLHTVGPPQLSLISSAHMRLQGLKDLLRLC